MAKLKTICIVKGKLWRTEDSSLIVSTCAGYWTAKIATRFAGNHEESFLTKKEMMQWLSGHGWNISLARTPFV